jgi:hypothetical protein
MKSIISKFGNLLLTGFICFLIGTLLMVLSFMLPSDVVKAHVSTGIDFVLAENKDDEALDGITKYILKGKESYTDSIMLQNAMEDVDNLNPFEQAMWMYHSDFDSEIWTPMDSIKFIVDGGDADSLELRSYGRYWHGYLFPLKLLLCLLPVNCLYIFNAIFQALLFSGLGVLCVKRKRIALFIALSFGYLFMKPVLILSSFTMSIINVVSLIFIMYLLFNHAGIYKRNHFPELFLILGIVTSYADFLTYPVVTLGFLLITYFTLYNDTLLKNFLSFIYLSFLWALGYGSMWISKWILAEFTLHTGTLKNAVSSLVGWTDVVGGRPRGNGLFYTLSYAKDQYASPVYIVLLILVVIVNIVALSVSIYKKNLNLYLTNIATFTLVALLPIVWLFVAEHHSAVHIHFVFRILGISAAAFMAAATTTLVNNKSA